MSFTIVDQENIRKKGDPVIIPGTKKSKDPFTEGQKKQAGFAVRMESALETLNRLEDAGFNPVNLQDVMIDNLPFIPEFFERYFLSPKYKQYQRAVIDFATAQLRQETGAVINESEIDWMYLTYFPQLGDDPVTLKNKREARDNAFIAMKGQAGKAYDRTNKELERIKGKDTKGNALEILKKRAETDEELRKKLEEKGLL
tara:strand:- start:2711 stop:3310 length:600 start_codon:yes stop_codon:yes gene_type:complete